MGGGRNKSKKFLRQKFANNKKRGKDDINSTINQKKLQSEKDKLSSIQNVGGHNTALSSHVQKDKTSPSKKKDHDKNDDESDWSDELSIVSEFSVDIASATTLDDNTLEILFDELNEKVEELKEKDAVTRQLAIDKLSEDFCLRYSDDYLRGNNHYQDIITMLMDSLKKGDYEEQLRALRLISIIIITIQDDHPKLISWLKPTLTSIIEKPSSPMIQLEAISVYATLIFLSENEQEIMKALKLLEKLWNPYHDQQEDEKEQEQEQEQEREKENGREREREQKQEKNNDNKIEKNKDENNNEKQEEYDQLTLQKSDSTNTIDSLILSPRDSVVSPRESVVSPRDDNNDNNNNNNNNDNKDSGEDENQTHSLNPQVATVALNNWTLIITSVSADKIAMLCELYVKLLTKLLKETHYAPLKCALGETLTLFVSSYNYIVKKTNFDDDDLPKIDSDNVIEMFENILHEIDSGKIRNKQELKTQKHKFREYLQTLDNNYKVQHHKHDNFDQNQFDIQWPIVIIKLRGNIFEIQGWPKNIQYHRIKQILGKGFQIHLLRNHLVQHLFDIEINPNVETSNASKDDKKTKLMGRQETARRIQDHRKNKRIAKTAHEHEDMAFIQ